MRKRQYSTSYTEKHKAESFNIISYFITNFERAMDKVNTEELVHVCQVVIQSIVECIDGGRLHNMRRKSVPIVDLWEKKFFG